MVEKDVKIVLTLSVKEAHWLQGVMQNPLQDEERDIREIRHGIFNCVREGLDLAYETTLR